MSTSSSTNIRLTIVSGSLQAASAHILRYPSPVPDSKEVAIRTSRCYNILKIKPLLTKMPCPGVFLVAMGLGFCALILFVPFLLRRARNRRSDYNRRESVYDYTCSSPPEKAAAHAKTGIETEENPPPPPPHRPEEEEKIYIPVATFPVEEKNPAYYSDEFTVPSPEEEIASDALPLAAFPPPLYVPSAVPWFPEFSIADLPLPTLEFDAPPSDLESSEPLIAFVDRDQSEVVQEDEGLEFERRENASPRRSRSWDVAETPARTIVDQGVNFATGQRWKRRVTVYAGGEGILRAGAGFVGARC
ncbi:hypothetical protein RUND412_008939 [Rhizina undulata]